MTEPTKPTKAVVVKAETVPAAPPNEGDALLSLIERAARDPAVDIDKMERLFAMRERMMASTAKAAYLAALARMQPKLPIIDKKGHIKTNVKDGGGQKTGEQKKQSDYAKWEDVVEGIMPVLAEDGFSLTFRIAQPTLDRVVTTAVLGHAAGHSEETSISLPLDTSGSKNNVQGWGSSVSFGKRYAGFAILNIVARGEDDDGQAAGGAGLVSEDQLTELTRMLDAQEADIPKFCRLYQITQVSMLPASKFEDAKKAIAKAAEAKRKPRP